MLLGHKPLNVLVKKGLVQTIRDQRGIPLLEIMLCERCRLMYWTPVPLAQEKTPGASP